MVHENFLDTYVIVNRFFASDPKKEVIISNYQFKQKNTSVCKTPDLTEQEWRQMMAEEAQVYASQQNKRRNMAGRVQAHWADDDAVVKTPTTPVQPRILPPPGTAQPNFHEGRSESVSPVTQPGYIDDF